MNRREYNKMDGTLGTHIRPRTPACTTSRRHDNHGGLNNTSEARASSEQHQKLTYGGLDASITDFRGGGSGGRIVSVVVAAGPPDVAPLHSPHSSTYVTVHVPWPTADGSMNVARVSVSTNTSTVMLSSTGLTLPLLDSGSAAWQLKETRAGETNLLPVTATVSPTRPYL